MPIQIIHTDAAPSAIGAYSQAVRAGDTVYISGQIPLCPATMEVVEGDFRAATRRVFESLAAIATATGGDLGNIVKLTVYLTDLANFTTVNEVMAEYFQEPYPARAAVEVAGLPRGVPVEVDAIMHLAP